MTLGEISAYINSDISRLPLNVLMYLIDIEHFGTSSYALQNSESMDIILSMDECVNNTNINGKLLEYTITSGKNVGSFFKRMTGIDSTVSWDTLTTINLVASSDTAVTAIYANDLAKAAVADSQSAITEFSSNLVSSAKADVINTCCAGYLAKLIGYVPTVFSTFNTLINNYQACYSLGESTDALNYIFNNSVLANKVMSNTIPFKQLLSHSNTVSIIAASSVSINALSTNETGADTICQWSSAINAIMSSETDMKVLAESSMFMTKVGTYSDSMNAVLANINIFRSVICLSSTALSALSSSPIGLTKIGSDDAFALSYMLASAGYDPSAFSSLKDVLDSTTTVFSDILANNNATNMITNSAGMLITIATYATWATISPFFTLVNKATSYVVNIYNLLVNRTDKFTVGTRVDQDGVSSMDSYCKTANTIYALHMAGWSSNDTQKCNLSINGTAMGYGSRATACAYGVDASTVNAIGIASSTFTETGDARVSVVPYTIK